MLKVLSFSDILLDAVSSFSSSDNFEKRLDSLEAKFCDLSKAQTRLFLGLEFNEVNSNFRFLREGLRMQTDLEVFIFAIKSGLSLSIGQEDVDAARSLSFEQKNALGLHANGLNTFAISDYVAGSVADLKSTMRDASEIMGCRTEASAAVKYRAVQIHNYEHRPFRTTVTGPSNG